jgi:hypothetical protein
MSVSKIASKKSVVASKKSVAPVSTSPVSVSEPAEPKPVATPVSQTVAANPSATVQASPVFLARVARCSALLDEAIALFQDGTDLTSLDRKRIKKIRKGGEKIIPIVAQAAKQAGVNLPLAQVAPMEESLAEAQALVPLQAKLGLLQKRISDQSFTSDGGSWATATALYSVLRRLSKNNGQLATLLAPANEFFKSRGPAARAAHPRTKKGKEALAQKKAAEAAAASPSSSSPSETAASPGTSAPAAAASPTVAVPNGAASTNGALNGAAHS